MLAAAVLLTATAACTSPPAPTPTGSTSSVSAGAATTSATLSSSTPTPSVIASPTPPATASPTSSGSALAPYTGGPVLAVKIDNTSAARPRIGLSSADIVYVEPVEAGLTRLLAIYSTSMPPTVGPVRSARESDPEVLGNLGRIAFAYSGVSAYTQARISNGPQVNLSNDASSQGFRRDGSRPAPYNVIGFPAQLLARAGGSAPPGDNGFRYGPAPAGATPTSMLATRYPGAALSFAWNPQRAQYLVTTDGRPEISDGAQVGAATVVVQRVQTYASGNRDVLGNVTPVVKAVGSGEAVVLRGGQAFRGTWARPSAQAPTTFTTAAGQPMTFAPGPVWVLLVPAGQAYTLG